MLRGNAQSVFAASRQSLLVTSSKYDDHPINAVCLVAEVNLHVASESKPALSQSRSEVGSVASAKSLEYARHWHARMRQKGNKQGYRTRPDSRIRFPITVSRTHGSQMFRMIPIRRTSPRLVDDHQGQNHMKIPCASASGD